MNLYLLERTDSGLWDQDTAKIVVASSEDSALEIAEHDENANIWWTNNRNYINVTFLGVAKSEWDKPQVVFSAWQAG